MEVLPDVILAILSGIHLTTSKIQSTSKQVKVNKSQSVRLSERVSRIVELIDEKNIVDSTSGPLRKALENFHQFLLRSLELIRKFVKANWFMRVLRHSNHATKFQDLNEELSYHCQDLTLGLQITIYRKFLAEDKIDAQNDLVEIKEIIHGQQTRMPSVQIRTNSSVKVNTNVPSTNKIGTHSQHRTGSHRTQQDSSPSPSYISQSMNIGMKDHRQFVANHYFH